MGADNKKNSEELLPVSLQQFIEKISVDVINYAKTLDQNDDFWFALDGVLLNDGWPNDAKFELCLLLANRYLKQGNKILTEHFCFTANQYISEDNAVAGKQLQLIGEVFHELERKATAASFILEGLTRSGVIPQGTGTWAKGLVDDFIQMRLKDSSHGHDLLVDYLNSHSDRFAAGITFIEIGTTREQLQSQGSTSILAELCHRRDYRFITVDMDEHNGRMANEMFLRNGYPFNAVSAKGEDFLHQWKGEFHVVFLDAYDFDHGGHSDLRQSRYKKFLGSKIDQEACHQMHLDCAKAIIEKLASNGVVCVDDTWLDENEQWTAKGTLAIPFLIDNGFSIIDQRNNAVLLQRSA
ncbi:hypothetical protein N9V74_05065 [Alteromonas sp.]|nr:hypothetical protein [Alteromonas sp.]